MYMNITPFDLKDRTMPGKYIAFLFLTQIISNSWWYYAIFEAHSANRSGMIVIPIIATIILFAIIVWNIISHWE